ncbi:MAG: CvpA family protein [Ruminococcaceae bacterium]|nr:CvpA family protein [Oscillospiraceae bacterium]
MEGTRGGGFGFIFSKIKEVFDKDYVEVVPQHKGKKIAIAAVLTLVITAVRYYVSHPPINLKSQEFWMFLIMTAVIYAVILTVLCVFGRRTENVKFAVKHSFKTSGVVIVLCLLVLGIGLLISSTFFNARRYADLINISDGNFTEDIEDIGFDEIPMLDNDSAIKLGNAKLGELSDMVSQFEVDDSYYTQINYKGTPYRVTTLRYGDFFKWFKHTKEGLPAYVMINMVTQEAKVARLESGIKYSESEFFNHKLSRYVQFHYPTKMIYSYNFEIDDKGVPYWIVSCYRNTIGLFGGQDIKEVILLNAVTGESELYALDKVPNWVDRAVPADLIINQYNYHGTYAYGFWNSIIGQKGVKNTTDGYNYIAQNDDVYMYTGVTSVNGDTGNIGFLLSNQRTKQTKFYALSGAIESVAMGSAEGEAQNYKYTATFPLLLNVDGQPTYFMAMKDTSALVKGYAMVNVKQYQIVSFANSTDPEVCKAKYEALLGNKKLVNDKPAQTTEAKGVIEDIRSAVIEGNTYYFIKLKDSENYFKLSAAENNAAVIMKPGDKVVIKFDAGADLKQQIVGANIIEYGK